MASFIVCILRESFISLYLATGMAKWVFSRLGPWLVGPPAGKAGVIGVTMIGSASAARNRNGKTQSTWAAFFNDETAMVPNWHATSRQKVLEKTSSIYNYVVDRFVSLKIWKLKIKNFEDIMEVLQFEDVFWLFFWHTKFHKTSGFYHHALAEAQM